MMMNDANKTNSLKSNYLNNLLAETVNKKQTKSVKGNLI